MSSKSPMFVQAQLRQGGQWMTILARREPGEEPTAVAVTRRQGTGAGEFVSVQFLPDASDSSLDVLALEHLYALALRGDALSHYCLAVGRHPCDIKGPTVSHDQLLRELAGERMRAVSLAKDPIAVVPWRSITMAAIAGSPSDPDDVSVQVFDEGRPLSGIAVYFNRAPHSGCSARTGANGAAACRLVDQHGDDGDHADDDVQSKVIVTYPGDVRSDRVLLPTTFVLPGGGR